MAIGPSDLLSAMQNGVVAIQQLTTSLSSANASIITAVNTLNTTVATLFPRGVVTSSAPTAGGTTFTSSQAPAFLLVTTSSGATYKMPLYTV